MRRSSSTGNAGGWTGRRSFFAGPPTLTDVAVRPVRIRRRTYERVVFDSGYEPRPGEPGRERWAATPPTTTCRRWCCGISDPRPWVVCVHGALMGRGAVDLRLFRARHLHDDLGLNVVLPVLPLHGSRKHRGAAFPGEDVLDDVHATAQAVWDIRRLMSWIRTQEPDSPIGLNGMSLGGYVTALVASLEDGLTCAVLGVPVADLIDVLGRHAGLRDDDPRRQALALAEPLGRMVSPLSLLPRVPMAGPVHLCRRRRPAGTPARPGAAPLGALGQTRDRVVPGWPHRVLPVAPGTRVRRRRAHPVGSCRN